MRTIFFILLFSIVSAQAQDKDVSTDVDVEKLLAGDIEDISSSDVNLHGASPVVSRRLCLFQATLAPNSCF